MPHTNKKASNVPPPPFRPASFVNVPLDDTQKALIKATSWPVEAFDTGVGNLLGAGYKITLRYDERNDCFACWLIAPDKSENKGLILSGRGSTPYKAMKQAVYIHFALLEGLWGANVDLGREPIDD